MKLLLFFILGFTLLLSKGLSLRLDQEIIHFTAGFVTQTQQSIPVPSLESESNIRKVQTVEDYVEQYTDSPFNQEATTTVRYDRNLTLDNANDTDRDWQISPVRLTLKKWFEYYNNTDKLRENSNDNSRCPYIISEFSNQLSEVEGIWMACRDPALPEDCSSYVTPAAACHPYISYSIGTALLVFQTVKINLAVTGLAIVRLTTGSSTIGTNARCFDFSFRRDPFSSCEYIKVESTSATGWTQVKSNFSAYDGFSFGSFTVQLIARFENDVAIVEKVEATDYLLCDENRLCTTTSPGPTHSTTTTTPTTTTTKNTATTTRTPTKTATLDIFSDTENQIKWQVSNLSSRWLEYYDDSSSLVDQADNSNACASMVAPIVADNLSHVEGIWSSCQDSSFPTPPNITYSSYSSSNAESVVSLTAKFYLYGSAFIRLHVGNKCIDFSYTEVSQSNCDWRKLQQDGIYWQGIFWSSNSVSEQVKEFSIDLISLAYEDVVLLDKIVVIYTECSNNDCQHSSTAYPSTTTLETSSDFSTEKETDYPTSESTITTSITEISENTPTLDTNTESTESIITTPEGSSESTNSPITTPVSNTDSTEYSDSTDIYTESSNPSTSTSTITSSSSSTPRTTSPSGTSNSNSLKLNILLIVQFVAIIAIFYELI